MSTTAFNVPELTQSSQSLVSKELTVSESMQRRKSTLVLDEPESFVDSKRFNIVIAGLIVLNTIQLGLACDLYGPEWDKVWNYTEYFFTACFSLEMAIKLYALRCKYFKCLWNLLDAALVMCSLVELIVFQVVLSELAFEGNFTMLRALRLLRTARISRMVRIFKELRVLVEAILNSMKTMAWFVLLVCLMVYVFAILCVEVIGKDTSYPDYSNNAANLSASGFNNYQFFGNLWRSMYTVFSLITLSEWSSVSRPIAEKQLYMLPALIFFTMFTAFGIMNIIVGIMAQHAVEAAIKCNQVNLEQQLQDQLVFFRNVETILTDSDTDNDGYISLEEFQAAMEQDVNLGDLMDKADLPGNFTVKELFITLDTDGDGKISPTEFHKEMYRLVHCNDFQRMCIMQHSLNTLKHQVKQIAACTLHGQEAKKLPCTGSKQSHPHETQQEPKLRSQPIEVAQELEYLQSLVQQGQRSQQSTHQDPHSQLQSDSRLQYLPLTQLPQLSQPLQTQPSLQQQLESQPTLDITKSLCSLCDEISLLRFELRASVCKPSFPLCSTQYASSQMLHEKEMLSSMAWSNSRDPPQSSCKQYRAKLSMNGQGQEMPSDADFNPSEHEFHRSKPLFGHGFLNHPTSASEISHTRSQTPWFHL